MIGQDFRMSEATPPPTTTTRVLQAGTEEHTNAEKWLARAAEEMQTASCQRERSGAVIVDGNETLIGCGRSGPPGKSAVHQRCGVQPPANFSSDASCCIHAETRALLDALDVNNKQLPGSRLYVVSSAPGGELRSSGKPSCTVCSKLGVELGITEFVLSHEDGITVYEAGYYNRLSFEYVQTPEELADAQAAASSPPLE